MFVVCINNYSALFNTYLTLDKVYQVVSVAEGEIEVINDEGRASHYYSGRFIEFFTMELIDIESHHKLIKWQQEKE